MSTDVNLRQNNWVGRAQTRGARTPIGVIGRTSDWVSRPADRGSDDPHLHRFLKKKKKTKYKVNSAQLHLTLLTEVKLYKVTFFLQSH